MSDQSFLCPCCGFRGLKSPPYQNLTGDKLIRGVTPPYYTHFGMPSYEVCNCCGFEFGNDDDPGTAEPDSFESYLKEWELNGCMWFKSDLKPDNWSLSSQLAFAELGDI
jgi:hypothetical protein